MEILLVSDLHYDLRQFDWVLQAAAEVDAVVLAGDLLDISSPVPLQAQIAVVQAYLARLGELTTVAACSGNHDLDHRRDDGEKATRWLPAAAGGRVHADGASFMLGADLVSVVGWWEGDHTRAIAERQLEEAATRPRERWLWVYHSPPTGLLSWTGTRHFGDDVVAGWVERHRPDLVLCGHIHQAPFTPEGSWHEQRGRTLLLNAGRQRADRPSHIRLDLTAGLASWHALHDEQRRTLPPIGSEP